MTKRSSAGSGVLRFSPLILLVLALLSAPLTMGFEGCEPLRAGPCHGEHCSNVCEYNGERYRVGDTFPSADGCNSCGCNEGGLVACTARFCLSSCGGLSGLSCDEGQYCQYPPDAQCGAADQTGWCADIPEFCTEQYEPVCGCDDRTYGNACQAAAQGVSVAYQGECGGPGAQTCGTLGAGPCSDDAFCDFPEGANCGRADAPGTCEPRPEYCPEIWMPVCGCDGQTYGNTCEANRQGVSVEFDGECGEPCGGLLGLSCAEGEFCNYPPEAICGAADATGICTERPSACTKEYRPVCGCDGQTYGNACTAASAGVSVASEGECGGGVQGDICGTRGVPPCGSGLFCDFPRRANCGATDRPGTCEPMPEVCDDIFEPVCGCDGQTYANACEANAAGTSAASDGGCGGGVPPVPPEGELCGGLLGVGCAKGEFCNYPPEAICGAADAPGVCTERPDICTLQYDPVCGCDGQTYGNACQAASAGVSIVSEGECGGVCEYFGVSYPAGASFPSADGCNQCKCDESGAVACTLRACVDFCGGIAGFGCPRGQFCDFPISAQCGAGDQTGTCRSIPDFCTEQYEPVCGCDNQTYSNSCFAAAGAMSVSSTGACK